jgi:predicted AlkP superfamily phosphohydrolase/phosphomutase
MISSKKKMLVVGLDSATWRVLDPLMERGCMPFLQSLAQRGSRAVLRSTVPPVTAAAWTSFLTGLSPGVHGLYNFWMHDPGTYDARYVDGSALKHRALWNYLNDAGLKVGLVNVPMTYPVKPLDGFMISGLLTPESAQDFCHPPELKERIRKRWPNYMFTFEWVHYRYDPPRLVDRLLRWLDQQSDVCSYLMREEPWDVFVTVICQTDIIQHAAMNLIEEGIISSKGVRRSLVALLERFYARVDAAVQRLVEEAGTDIPVIMLSDHGSERTRRVVYLDELLLREGLLHYFPSSRFGRVRERAVQRAKVLFERLDWLHVHARFRTPRRFLVTTNRQRRSAIDFTTSRAFTSGTYGGLYPGICVNLKGRERDGVVEPADEYEGVRDLVIEQLRDVKDEDGSRVFADVARREEVYSGRAASNAPDVVPVPAAGYSILGKRCPAGHIVADPEPGMIPGAHSPEGIVLMAGPGMTSGKTASGADMCDLLPTMLHWLGLRLPRGLDGRALHELFTPELAQSEIQYSQVDATETIDTETRSGAEQQSLESRLRGLGYLD